MPRAQSALKADGRLTPYSKSSSSSTEVGGDIIRVQLSPAEGRTVLVQLDAHFTVAAESRAQNTVRKGDIGNAASVVKVPGGVFVRVSEDAAREMGVLPPLDTHTPDIDGSMATPATLQPGEPGALGLGLVREGSGPRGPGAVGAQQPRCAGRRQDETVGLAADEPFLDLVGDLRGRPDELRQQHTLGVPLADVAQREVVAVDDAGARHRKTLGARHLRHLRSGRRGRTARSRDRCARQRDQAGDRVGQLVVERLLLAGDRLGLADERDEGTGRSAPGRGRGRN